MLKCFSRTVFSNVKQQEQGNRVEERIARERKRERKGERGVRHLFDCYLGATVSNYWLEPLKKLITGSHRQRSGRRTNLGPGTTQLSVGLLATTLGGAATRVAT